MNTKKERSQLPFRLNILFFVIFLLFSVLILQLGVVQILDGASYQEDIDRTVQDTTKIPVPRGKILDRTHKVLVDNAPLYSITYTPQKGVQAEDNLEVAKKLVEYISVDDEAIEESTERKKKEYWYLLSEENQDDIYSRLTEEELDKLDDVEQYNRMLELITEDENSDLSEEQLKHIAIKRELDKAYALTPQVVKNEGVTPEEYARVSEHLHLLPGINATTDWDREYPFDKTLSTFLGTITTQEQGIPKEREAYFLSHGYSRNDRVGRSGLEDYYENILRGRKEQIQYTMDKRGKIIDSEVIVQGERGKDLILTIDMDFQKKVDKIVAEELNNAMRAHGQNRYLADYIDALAVVMNPKTGEILALSGKHYNKDTQEIEDATHKTIYDAHRPGSAIKGATVLAGFESGVVSPGTVIYDAPIKISGTNPKGSYARLGPVNDIDAIERSSNVFMFQIAMRMGGEVNYYYD